MNLISAKNLSELHLNGVKIDWVKEDKSIKEIRLHDGNGGRIVIRAGTYGDVLKVMIPQPHEQAERFLLSGKFLDLTDVREYFESEYEAKDKLSNYEAKVRGESGLSVKKVTVEIDDAGNVVEAVGTPISQTSEAEIPF